MKKLLRTAVHGKYQSASDDLCTLGGQFVGVRSITVNNIAGSLNKKMKVKQYKLRSKFMQKIKMEIK